MQLVSGVRGAALSIHMLIVANVEHAAVALGAVASDYGSKASALGLKPTGSSLKSFPFCEL